MPLLPCGGEGPLLSDSESIICVVRGGAGGGGGFSCCERGPIRSKKLL